MTRVERANYYRKAAAHMDQYGMLKGSLYNITLGDQGPVCVAGALMVATGSLWNWNTVLPFANEIAAEAPVQEYIAFSPSCLPMQYQAGWAMVNWNNAPERTKEEVTGLLRDLADRLELAEQIDKATVSTSAPAIAAPQKSPVVA